MKPLDSELLHEVFSEHKFILTVEDGSITGGIGTALMEFAHQHHYQPVIKSLGVPDQFIPHGSPDELKQICGFDIENIYSVLNQLLDKLKT